MKQSHSQNDQNIVKSIIYGNIIQTNYGMIRALCSAIGSKDHIDKIVLYLRNNHNFLKYNKFVYSFRLEHVQSDVFITEGFQGRQKFLQGFNDDTGFQGVGQKLLALLQKFNVRNVLVILAIRQRDPLRQMRTQNYVQMIKCAKQLLSSLYDKVVNSKPNQSSQLQQQDLKQPIQVKEYKIPLEEFVKKQKLPFNPNYVGQQFVKRNKIQSIQDKYKSEITFLNVKIKQLAEILQQIIQKFGQAQDAQVKFSIKYDKNKKVQKVFDMLAQLFEFKSKEDFLDQSISIHLKSITSKNLTSKIIRKLNEEIMSDKTLKSQILIKQNQISGILMQFIQVLLKSYGFAKKLALVQSQIQESQKKQNKNQKLSNQTFGNLIQ